MDSIINSKIKIGNLELKNRLVRSATYEGAADRSGIPNANYKKMYEKLAKNQVGMIITGFAFVSTRGKAMQTAQAGIDSRDKIEYYKEITNICKEYNCPIILQIAHTGRQTLQSETLQKPISSTTKKSIYFNQASLLAAVDDIHEIVRQFSASAQYAKEAGFDGIQLHAGHGYLLHQFLLPETNILKNEYGIDKQTGIGTKILDEIIDAIREKCGQDYPILIKISGDHDLSNNFYPEKYDNLIKFLDSKKLAAIEISYGTMDHSMNIFRGELNLDTVFKYNPLFSKSNAFIKFIKKLYIKVMFQPKFKQFSPTYNLQFAERAKKLTYTPIISVGGFRSKHEIENALTNNSTDLVSLCRPFISEPDFAKKVFESEANYNSKCTCCNECAFMVDSGKVTACYTNQKNK